MRPALPSLPIFPPTLAPKVPEYPPPPSEPVRHPVTVAFRASALHTLPRFPTAHRLGNRRNSALTRSASSQPRANPEPPGSRETSAPSPGALWTLGGVAPGPPGRPGCHQCPAGSACTWGPTTCRQLPPPPAAATARREPGVRGAPASPPLRPPGVEPELGARETCKWQNSAPSAPLARRRPFQAAPACASQLETKARRQPRTLRPKKLERRVGLYLETPALEASAALRSARLGSAPQVGGPGPPASSLPPLALPGPNPGAARAPGLSADPPHACGVCSWTRCTCCHARRGAPGCCLRTW